MQMTQDRNTLVTTGMDAMKRFQVKTDVGPAIAPQRLDDRIDKIMTAADRDAEAIIRRELVKCSTWKADAS